MRRSGFTLLEVIVALAILTGSLAVLGELVRRGLDSAERARDLSRATLIAEAKMTEVVALATAGAGMPQAISSAVVEAELDRSGTWLYSIELGDTGSPEVMAVRVTVQRDQAASKRPISSSLTRWVRAVIPTSSDTSSTSGSSSAGTAGSASGGSQGGM
jgi:type II secretion system protein I